MTLSTVRGRGIRAALLLTSGLALASCTGSHGTAGADQQIVASCPSNPVASTVGLDVSGSFQSDLAKTAAMDTVAAEVRRAVLCAVMSACSRLHRRPVRL